jgi:hypothetical protein
MSVGDPARDGLQFVSVLRKVYGRSKHAVAWVLIVIAAVGNIFSLPSLEIPAVIALATIAIELLFSLDRRLLRMQSTAMHENFYAVSLALRSEIIERSHRNKKITIRAIGMSMAHAWPFFTDVTSPIIGDRSIRLNLLVALLDPAWVDIQKVNRTWAEQAKTSYASMVRFSETHRQSLITSGSRISISLYAHMPNWHGVLIDDDTLFLSTCVWKNGSLNGAENSYEIIRSGERNEAVRRIEHFRSWFDKVSAPENTKTWP